MVTVGIDPHKPVHVAVAVDAAGRPVGKPLTFKNSPLQITVLLTWIRAIAGDLPVTWAIEDGRGFARRLADGLLMSGQEVVWVPARLAAAHRRLHAATGAKSDPVDAAAAARAAMAMPALDRHRIDEHVRELRVLAGCVVHFVNSKAEPVPQAPQLFAVGTGTSSARFGTPA